MQRWPFCFYLVFPGIIRHHPIMKSPPADLALALDVPSHAALTDLLLRLPASLRWCKVGLELFCAQGPSIIESLRIKNKQIFLDLKLHDIPRTVERAAQAASRHGVGLLTIHAGGGRAMIQAAVEGARSTGEGTTKIIAVTALTSLSDKDLHETGVAGSTADHVLRLGDLARAAGADGLVCSPLEVNLLRQRLGPDIFLITPGIRSGAEPAGDQKRTATVADAVAGGSNLLVVGRPIVEALDPHAATLRILDEIAHANQSSQHRTP
jgi:orotidine-5'-phosphate decarboxylase